MKYCWFFLSVILGFAQCRAPEEKLPILGNRDSNGGKGDHSIASFSFLDQDSATVTNATFLNQVYVADFIFLSCPTICPVMNVEMLRVYKAFEKNQGVAFLSHTIDPANDSIPRLKAYAENLGINASRWHFVTGNQDSIYKIAEKSYFTSVYPDSVDKSNYIHGGGLVLIDTKRRIRGVYDGTNPLETERLIKEINLLLKE